MFADAGGACAQLGGDEQGRGAGAPGWSVRAPTDWDAWNRCSHVLRRCVYKSTLDESRAAPDAKKLGPCAVPGAGAGRRVGLCGPAGGETRLTSKSASQMRAEHVPKVVK